MSDRRIEADYAFQLTDSQGRLYAYIISLVVDREWAKDILQNTNRILLEKADQFEPGTNFIAWAFTIARLQVMAARKTTKRETLLDDELTATIADISADRDANYDAELAALNQCMQRLDDRQRALVLARNRDDIRVQDAADRIGVKPNTASQIIHRARLDLLECIRRRLADTGETA